ncbi:hypothetical protein QS257_09005 [Terrilactibacillus sp. S3-3]|nr:hypothetical protein QS257_09005 [Terrilactibacillus sp. S3-3]
MRSQTAVRLGLVALVLAILYRRRFTLFSLLIGFFSLRYLIRRLVTGLFRQLVDESMNRLREG